MNRLTCKKKKLFKCVDCFHLLSKIQRIVTPPPSRALLLGGLFLHNETNNTDVFFSLERRDFAGRRHDHHRRVQNPPRRERVSQPGRIRPRSLFVGENGGPPLLRILTVQRRTKELYRYVFFSFRLSRDE